MSGVSDKPTRYAIICPKDGQVFLTRDEYNRQMLKADARWMCPACVTTPVEFDEDNYDNVSLEEDGPSDAQLADQAGYERDPFLFVDKDDPGWAWYRDHPNS